MTAKETASLRAKILIQDNGSPEEQKASLVDAILDSFNNPSSWPMTDAQRIALLQSLYTRAQTIKTTEEALKDL